jgi:hypothetical protein
MQMFAVKLWRRGFRPFLLYYHINLLFYTPFCIPSPCPLPKGDRIAEEILKEKGVG